MSENTNLEAETITEKVTSASTDEAIQETPVEGVSETAVNEEEVKEETSEVSAESIEESTEETVEETVEETKEEVPVEEDDEVIDEYVDVTDLPENAGDSDNDIPEADVTNPDVPEDETEADPLPEEEGIYYCEVTIGFHTRNVVEERLEKYDIPFIVTATGIILVGPYQTEEEAVAGRKLLLTRGLKGTVVTFE